MGTKRTTVGVIGIVVSLIVLGCVGIAGLVSTRRVAAKAVFLRAVELGRNGSWDEAFALTHPDYRRYANLVNFKGDLSEVANEGGEFRTNLTVTGGWNYVQVRYEYKNQPDWGVYFELRRVDGAWRIADRGRWTTSSEF